MYSINLAKFSITDFVEILKSIDLLPGRRILLTEIEALKAAVDRLNINNLADLQILLKRKADYPKLAFELGISEDYLIVLNREISSYVSKPLKIDDINFFTSQEIVVLTNLSIKTTKDLYLKALNQSDRKLLSQQSKISIEKICEASGICDLLRVNGIGPSFARALTQIGIRSVSDYLNSQSTDILVKFESYVKTASDLKSKLGLKDIEYCKRFCRKLEIEMEISGI